MRQMRFTTVQELKSQPKLLSWLYAKDLVMIACFVCVMSVFQGFVHPGPTDHIFSLEYPGGTGSGPSLPL